MNRSVTFETQNNNLYLYDNEQELSMLIHPRLREAIENQSENDSYYWGKYNYLKSKGFFSAVEVNLVSEIKESTVKESLIRTPQVLFEVTDSCNLNCKYCALSDVYDWDDNRNSKEIDTDLSIKLLQYIINLKIINHEKELVVSFYGGEPLLNIQFIKRVVSFCNKENVNNKISIRYNLTTNGLLLKKHIKFLVANSFNLLISLDGGKENDSYRVTKHGQESFDTVIENIDYVKNEYSTYFDEKVNFNAVLHNRNSVKNIYEFIFKRYGKFPQISEMNTIGVTPSHQETFKSMYKNKMQSEADYLKEDNRLLPHEKETMYGELIHFLKYSSINAYIANMQSTLKQTENYYPSSTCIPFSKRIFLTTKGNLLPCEKINYNYYIYHLSSEIEIDFRAIAELYSNYYSHLKTICSKCYIYRFCGLCMFHLSHFEDISTPSFSCDYCHDEKRFSDKLKRVYTFLEDNPQDYFDIIENLVIES